MKDIPQPHASRLRHSHVMQVAPHYVFRCSRCASALLASTHLIQTVRANSLADGRQGNPRSRRVAAFLVDFGLIQQRREEPHDLKCFSRNMAMEFGEEEHRGDCLNMCIYIHTYIHDAGIEPPPLLRTVVLVLGPAGGSRWSAARRWAIPSPPWWRRRSRRCMLIC